MGCLMAVRGRGVNAREEGRKVLSFAGKTPAGGGCCSCHFWMHPGRARHAPHIITPLYIIYILSYGMHS